MTYSAFPGAAGECAACGSERQRVVDGDFDEARRRHRTLRTGDHASLVYDDPTAVAPFCARFLTEGVNAGERVVAGLQDDLREAVSPLLPADVQVRVEWKDPRSIYGNFDADQVAAKYGALISSEERPTRILAGIDGESAEGVDPDEMARYETLSHAIITGNGATVVCLYDEDSLPPAFVDVSERRHGLLVEDGAVRRNERFEYQPT